MISARDYIETVLARRPDADVEQAYTMARERGYTGMRSSFATMYHRVKREGIPAPRDVSANGRAEDIASTPSQQALANATAAIGTVADMARQVGGPARLRDILQAVEMLGGPDKVSNLLRVVEQYKMMEEPQHA